MRPVDKGEIPVDTEENPIEFRKYGDARDYLIERLGDYCSYCEMPRPDGPDVEHVLPKNHDDYRHLERSWTNFLLACRSCNSIKGSEYIELDDYFWPDRDNTWRRLAYEFDLPPKPSSLLEGTELEKIKRTIELTGLDRKPGHPRFSKKDRRWLKRREAWGSARRSFERLQENDTEDTREMIVEAARPTGFWSVWMTVFRKDTDMCRRLIDAFPGTCLNDER